jgi:Zn-dependent protease
MAGSAGVGVRWRLGAKTRKSILLLHIASAGTWLGVDVVMAVLIFTALGTDDRNTKALAFQALELFVVWSLLATGLTCLVTGILLGLSSRHGVLRYWWVAAKLGLNLLLTGLVLVALAPEVGEAGRQGRQFLAGEPRRWRWAT